MAHDMERQIGRLLQGGVILSASTMLLGGALYLSHPLAQPPDYAHFRVVATDSFSIALMVRAALRLDALSLIQLGTLTMVATPVARVLFSAVTFARERDGLYVAICAVILALLGYAILLGR